MQNYSDKYPRFNDSEKWYIYITRESFIKTRQRFGRNKIEIKKVQAFRGKNSIMIYIEQHPQLPVVIWRYKYEIKQRKINKEI